MSGVPVADSIHVFEALICFFEYSYWEGRISTITVTKLLSLAFYTALAMVCHGDSLFSMHLSFF